MLTPTGHRRGPGWRLIVATLPNPRDFSVDQWVDDLRTENNDPSRLDADSLDWLAPPDSLRVGVERALRVRPYCGDCEAYEVYVAAPHQMVMFGIVYDIGIPGDHATQKQLYDRILATFRVGSP